ncbi:hypothetical protein BN7_5906 [Wickerhamomyces ciferrii]|uniref:Uncharacterized protein n=1 Tax=Wickerhamomyces ciferrii (strain ATCC 14091 / BCRC 22168 / CBS 111 / JCM 3599 / NBRC 0793 / NRRL Y-1031 F-60-10) TaxID=1206466 RepID=K0KXZ3_WICCF|nr:uncharacterized protein BN7_5906 [Wickerhamomyces ciferrii]CCH46314.1 hypothetical protein BN7_5906 [Wickerhamomyces ciferrii]
MHLGDLNSLSSHSTYCPISVVVPALKQDHNIISGLAENLSEGIDIDERYDPDDFSSSNSEQENNRVSSIKDPRFFDDSIVSPISPNTENSKIASIKFDKFAQLLLYDGSKRSKFQKYKASLSQSGGKENIINQSEIEKRADQFKNRGSLNLSSASALSPNSAHRLKTFKISTLSRFSTYHIKPEVKPSYQYSSIDQIVSTLNDPLVSVRPILKSKHNVNASVESVRANFCDKVEVDDFMDFFEDFERHRSESEPYLGKVREKQLMKYYNSSESTSPTTDESAMAA